MECTLAFCTLRYSVYNLRICALHVVHDLRTFVASTHRDNIAAELRTVLTTDAVSPFN